MADSDPGDEQPIASEEEETRAMWRWQRLERAGYPPDIAQILAYRFDIDLETACQLMQRGCDLRTAERILL